MTDSVISEDLLIEGDLICSGPLQVRGRVHGDVVAGRLEVMVGGRIEGTVEADEFIVRGEHVGSAVCSSVRISSGATVRATITSNVLACDSGATLSGRLSIIGEAPGVSVAGGRSGLVSA